MEGEKMDEAELHAKEMWEKYKISPANIGRTSEGEPIYPEWYNPDDNVNAGSALCQAIDLIGKKAQDISLPPVFASMLEGIVDILESKIPEEQLQIQKAYRDGYLKHVSGSRCNLMRALDYLSEEYYKNTYPQNNIEELQKKNGAVL